MNLLPAIDVTADALTAEKIRLEVIGQNIANAHTTRGPDGLAYQRKVVTFETALRTAAGESAPGAGGVRVASIVSDPTPGELVYQPGHPHADANGLVRMPNVKLSQEMVDMIAASRAYEANLSVVRTARQMAQRALSIGR